MGTSNPTRSPEGLSRRSLLRGAAAAAALPAIPLSPRRSPLHPPLRSPLGYRTQRVILVAFAGGVRSREVIGSPENAPNIARIASQGVTLPNVRTRNVGHYGAALSIFTGNVEYMGIRDNERGLNPTMFEYLRKDVGLGAGDVWLSCSGGAQSRLFAHSDHPDYGRDFAANVLDGDGIFNVELKKILDSFGRPTKDSDEDRALLDRLGGALDPEVLQSVAGGKPSDPEDLRRVESFILDELAGDNTRLTGPGASDAKAIRVGANIFRVFKPKVLGITLQNHDIAHGSYNGYVEVIRRNDEEIGRLWDAIQQDDELRETTAVVILPEFGRDKDLNERNGLDHGDNSDDLRKVFCVASGPDFKRDAVVTSEVETIDLCPTLLSFFSKQRPRMIRAKAVRELFA